MSEWDKAAALAALDITEAPFELADGNTQGDARGRPVAVSPLAALPHKTLSRELAHVVLGHTSEGPTHDGERTPRALREVEAESVAPTLCETLRLEGADYCRGYVQSRLAGGTIPERSARKISHAADTILRAAPDRGLTISLDEPKRARALEHEAGKRSGRFNRRVR